MLTKSYRERKFKIIEIIMNNLTRPSMKEDNLIKLTLILMQDNDEKLDIVNNLNNLLSKMQGVSLEKIVEIELSEPIKSIITYIENSYKMIKHHLKKVNPRTSQTEEACKRIQKKRES